MSSRTLTDKRIVLQDATVPTPREVEVMQLIADGMTNKEIAKELTIAVDTVKQHVKAVSRKLFTRNRAHAAVTLVRRGIID